MDKVEEIKEILMELFWEARNFHANTSVDIEAKFGELAKGICELFEPKFNNALEADAHNRDTRELKIIDKVKNTLKAYLDDWLVHDGEDMAMTEDVVDDILNPEVFPGLAIVDRKAERPALVKTYEEVKMQDFKDVIRAANKKFLEYLWDEVLEECDEYSDVYLFPKKAYRELHQGVKLEVKHE